MPKARQKLKSDRMSTRRFSECFIEKDLFCFVLSCLVLGTTGQEKRDVLEVLGRRMLGIEFLVGNTKEENKYELLSSLEKIIFMTSGRVSY